MTNEEKEALESIKAMLENGYCDVSCSGPMEDEIAVALIRKGIAALERDRWISVEDGLPEEDKTVLTWGKQGVILLDWRHDNKWCCFGEVTHWMPLPEPPKEETNRDI